jgi:hypothetical protein
MNGCTEVPGGKSGLQRGSDPSLGEYALASELRPIRAGLPGNCAAARLTAKSQYHTKKQ